MENSFPAARGLPFEFTDKPVTPWGGLRLVQEMLIRMNFRAALEASGLPRPGSNRGYDPVEMMEAFLVCVWIGGVRFSHTSIVRFDEALCQMFGWERVASVSTFTRWFRRFNRERVDQVFGSLSRWFWDQLAPRTITLDLDSSVVTRFGKQEGAVVGYSRKNFGKPTHRPLFAFAADWRMVVLAWLRPGNTDDCNGTRDFIDEALRLLEPRHRVGLIRADGGFYDRGFLGELELKKVPYIVSGHMTGPLRQEIAGVRQWLDVGDGVAVSEFQYEGMRWKKARRMVVVRQELKQRPNALGKLLLEVPGYKFSAFVTTLDLPPAEVWRLYNGRGDSENRIAELKADFGLNGFCLHPFYATEAAFRSAMLGYNLMSLFRQALLQAPTAVRLSTMRFQCFALGSWIGGRGRKKVLRISLNPKRRGWFEGLFAKIEAFRCPWPAPT
ncbi:MAG: IS1380 family transposase [Elusimicrobiota bacterium]